MDYGWKEAVKTREFWLLALAGTLLAGADQLAMAFMFQLAGYRFQMERSYQLFSNVHEALSVVFILIGAGGEYAGGPAHRPVGVRSTAIGRPSRNSCWQTGRGGYSPGQRRWAPGTVAPLPWAFQRWESIFGRRHFATLMGTEGLLTVAFQGIVIWPAARDQFLDGISRSAERPLLGAGRGAGTGSGGRRSLLEAG